MTELARKLHGKFDWDRERALRAARFVALIAAVVVSPRRRLAILRDKPDNRVVECAVEGGANLVVTGDRHLLGLGTFESVQIVTVAYYLKYLDNQTVPCSSPPRPPALSDQHFVAPPLRANSSPHAPTSPPLRSVRALRQKTRAEGTLAVIESLTRRRR